MKTANLLRLAAWLQILVSAGAIAQSPHLADPEQNASAAPGEAGATMMVQEKTSPWILVPLLSSNPKIGTSAGGMAGYLFKLDPESTSSMAGVGVTYSTTDSYVGAAFLRAYWDHDSKRLTLSAGSGKINNDYEDFLGSGHPAQTTDDLRVAMARYLQRLHGDWFGGGQAIYTNYVSYSEDQEVSDSLDSLGLTGFDSVAIGLVGLNDTRDSQNSPRSGRKIMFYNYAYRKSLGGKENFDVYQVKYSQYLSWHNGDVFAFRADGRWTADASPSGYSSVGLRAYTRGQYLAPHALTLEMENRKPLGGRWGFNVFAGLACLYGDGSSCSNSRDLYPSAGIGGQYMLDPRERMVVSFDAAIGKSGNNGLYMRLGQAF